MRDDDDDDDDRRGKKSAGRPLKDWDCPDCNANNPSDESIGPKGIELRCNYCGVEFLITTTDEGKLKFREL